MQTSSDEGSIVLTFFNFNIESHSYGACIYDFLEITFDSFSWKYCGSIIPGPFTSTGTMVVKFHTDRLGTAQGFIAKWEEVQGNLMIQMIAF